MAKDVDVSASGQCMSYTHFLLDVFMPEGKECCRYCPCLKYDNDTEARRCKLTWEFILYPNSMRGERCPLELISKGNKED